MAKLCIFLFSHVLDESDCFWTLMALLMRNKFQLAATTRQVRILMMVRLMMMMTMITITIFAFRFSYKSAAAITTARDRLGTPIALTVEAATNCRKR